MSGRLIRTVYHKMKVCTSRQFRVFLFFPAGGTLARKTGRDRQALAGTADDKKKQRRPLKGTPLFVLRKYYIAV